MGCCNGVDNDCDGTTDAGDSGCVSANLPDLIGYWSLMKTKPISNETRWFVHGNLRVKNQGNANAGPFVIKFYYIPAGGSPQYLDSRDRSLPGRPAGRTTNVTFRHMFESNPSGGFILAVIDANGTVTESNESNNEDAKSIPF
jgi:hypothetical protein